jgi:hypothetical protein
LWEKDHSCGKCFIIFKVAQKVSIWTHIWIAFGVPLYSEKWFINEHFFCENILGFRSGLAHKCFSLVSLLPLRD